MEKEQCLKVLKSLLAGKVDGEVIATNFAVVEILKDRLDLSLEDVCSILIRQPKLFNADEEILVYNFDKISEVLDIKAASVRHLLIKHTNLLLYHGEVVTFRLKLLKTIFNMSMMQIVELLYYYPQLITLGKNYHINQIQMLSRALGEKEIDIQNLIRREPRLLFVKEDEIEKKILYFRKKFIAKIDEAQSALRRAPEILFLSESELGERYKCYYELGLVKYDLRQLLISSPEFFIIEPDRLREKFSQIKNYFSVSDKKAAAFILRATNLLFFDDLNEKFKFAAELKFDKNYVFYYPKVLTQPECNVVLKYMITRVTKTEDYFYKILDLSGELVFSRLRFMRAFKITRYLDLSLSEEEFSEKYNYSGESLVKNFPLNVKPLMSLIQEFSKLSFSKGALGLVNKVVELASATGSSPLVSVGEHGCALLEFGLSSAEVMMLENKNPNLAIFGFDNVLSLIHFYRREGLSLSEILELFFSCPALLSSSGVKLKK